jgi:hypothetical protein
MLIEVPGVGCSVVINFPGGRLPGFDPAYGEIGLQSNIYRRVHPVLMITRGNEMKDLSESSFIRLLVPILFTLVV